MSIRRRLDDGEQSGPNIWVVIVVFLLLGGLLAFGFRMFEAATERQSERGDANMRNELSRRKTIEYEGETYRLKKNLTAILLMGIDQFSDDADDPIYQSIFYRYRHGGQADFLRLVVIDDDAKEIRQLAIDRDTMTPIRILGVFGDVSSFRTEHISLSHASGDGKESSCEYTVEAVSNLLFGLPIDHYFALNMDGIGELNDWLGGVTVHVEDDFSQVDPTIVQGEDVTLHGDQAETFVRERASMNVGTNEGRMARQQIYLRNAQDILRAKLAGDANAAENFYDSLNLYFTTDMSKGTLSNIAYSTNEYEALEAVQPEGEHMINDDGFMEFHVDEQSLLRTIVETFYDKVE